MKASRHGFGLIVAAAATLAGIVAGAAQNAAPPPAAVQSAPLAAPPGSPPATLVQPVPQGAAPPAGAGAVLRPTLVPKPGDASDVDEVVLPAKPVLILSGSSTWEDGLKSLRAAFAAVEAELARLGIAPAGRPLAVFVQTTDENFRFDAMVPTAGEPDPSAPVPPGMRFGTTPSGKAWRFTHKGAYDEIDTTYETITTYLDAKDIVAKDAFIEEYVNDVADAADQALEINIFVQPR